MHINMMTMDKRIIAVLVVAFIGTISGLPRNLINHADLIDGNVILLPAEPMTGVDEGDVYDREERAVSSGSGSGPLPDGLTDDEDLTDGSVTASPRLSTKPEIIKLAVESKITARFASTEVRSKLKNLDKNAAEASLTLNLPKDAFISAFSMTIEGIVYHSEVKPKDVAQKLYNEAKARGQTAGQVKQRDPEDTKFQVSVTVAGRASVLFNLTYQQLLRRKDGMFEHRINIQPGQVVPDVRVEVHLTEPQGLKEVNASWMLVDSTDQTKLNDMTSVDVKSRAARVLFDSKGDAGLITSSHGIMGEFVVKYDVVHDMMAGRLEIVNGYFVHYFSPEGLPKTRKNVVFVIDTSGSMSGRKMEQTKTAFTTILDDVRKIDRFNIVLFESHIQTWRDNEMVPATRENLSTAKSYVRRINARGGTNLYDGLTKAVSLLMDHGSDDAMPLIIMLTDGQPTSGSVSNPAEITRRMTALIEGRLSLFSVGFGNGVDYSFLEKLSLSNQALARKVYEDSSATMQMKGFYDEVANPLLFNVNIDYTKRLVDEDSLTKSSFMAYFDGTEITVAGKLKDDVINAIWNSPDDSHGSNARQAATEDRSGSNALLNQTILAGAQNPETISVVDGNENDYRELCVIITAKSLDVDIEFNTSTTIENDRSLRRHEVDDFAQRLWAYLTIKNLLTQRKTVNDRETKDALTDRALNMSLKYHFVTPLTSLLVVKPDDEPRSNATVDDGYDGVNDELEGADVNQPISSQVYSIQPKAAPYGGGTAGSSGSGPSGTLAKHPASRGFGSTGLPLVPMYDTPSFADSDPHFMVEIPNSGVTVCFDINGDPGDVFNLLVDPKLNLSVSAYVIPATHKNSDPSGKLPTYFGKIVVLLGSDRYLLLTPESITVNNDAFKLRWGDELAMRVGDFYVQVHGKQHVVITHDNGVVVVVMLHRVRRRGGDNESMGGRIDHLGFYVEQGQGLSPDVHGIIGQFHRDKDVLILTPDAGTPNTQTGIEQQPIVGRVNATLHIDDRVVAVTLMTRRIPLLKDYRDCWHADDNAKGLIEGDYTDYKLPHLYARPTMMEN